MLAMAVLLGAGMATSFAHLDDPKEQDRVPRFEGPAYRADATFAPTGSSPAVTPPMTHSYCSTTVRRHVTATPPTRTLHALAP